MILVPLRHISVKIPVLLKPVSVQILVRLRLGAVKILQFFLIPISVKTIILSRKKLCSRFQVSSDNTDTERLWPRLY